MNAQLSIHPMVNTFRYYLHRNWYGPRFQSKSAARLLQVAKSKVLLFCTPLNLPLGLIQPTESTFPLSPPSAAGRTDTPAPLVQFDPLVTQQVSFQVPPTSLGLNVTLNSAVQEVLGTIVYTPLANFVLQVPDTVVPAKAKLCSTPIKLIMVQKRGLLKFFI